MDTAFECEYTILILIIDVSYTIDMLVYGCKIFPFANLYSETKYVLGKGDNHGLL